jgi:hypothetical protein
VELVTHRVSETCLEELVLEPFGEVSGLSEGCGRGRASRLAPLRVCVDVPSATPVLDCRSVSGVVPVVVEVGGRDSTGCTVV